MLTRTITSRWSLAILLPISVGAAEPAGAQLRIVSYNIAQYRGATEEFETLLRAVTDDPCPTTGLIRSPDVWVFQEVPAGGASELLIRLNRNSPIGVSYALATFTTNGGGSEQALAYRADTIVEDPDGHRDILNHTGPRAADRWKLALAADPDDSVFYVYGAHFKAGDTPGDELDRASEARAIRADADALGEGAHVIFAGDWNVYHPFEIAFLEFFEPGAGEAVDPSGFQFNFVPLSHTQSSHDGTNGNLTTGGMDDRFDFQLSTAEFSDGVGLTIEPGSYRAFANDGYHLNLPVNSGENLYFAALEQYKADAAARASDHVPVIVDYRDPTDRFRLQVGYLLAGVRSDAEAFGAAPDHPVYFIYSRVGLGETHVAQLGVTLRLDGPMLVGQSRADASGYARLAVRPPLGARGANVWMQAAQPGSVTDVVMREVE